MSMKRKTHPLAARIRQMMKADDDVGKIAQATPVLLVELFLQRLTEGMIGVALARNNKTLSPAHLKAYVGADDVMDFLKQTVASAPDMPEETDEAKPKAKRKRKAEGDDEGGASPKAAKPRVRKGKGKSKGKGKGKTKAEQGEEEEEEESIKEEGAAAGSSLDDPLSNGARAAAVPEAGEDAVEAEVGDPGEDAKGLTAAEVAPAAEPLEAAAALLSPPAMAAAVPNEDDYDDL